MLKAIFFDLDDTLCDRSITAEICLSILWQDFFGSANTAIGCDTFLHLVNSLTTPDRTRQQRFQRALENLPHPYGIHSQELSLELTQGYSDCVKERLRLFTGVNATLAALRSMYLLVLITNAPPDSQQAKVKALNVDRLVHHVVLTGEIGAHKPDPEVFRYALRLARVQANEAMHVGDDPEADIAGAKAAGLKTVWANIYRRQYAGLHKPDYEIQQIPELLKLPPIRERAIRLESTS